MFCKVIGRVMYILYLTCNVKKPKNNSLFFLTAEASVALIGFGGGPVTSALLLLSFPTVAQHNSDTRNKLFLGE